MNPLRNSFQCSEVIRGFRLAQFQPCQCQLNEIILAVVHRASQLFSVYISGVSMAVFVCVCVCVCMCVCVCLCVCECGFARIGSGAYELSQGCQGKPDGEWGKKTKGDENGSGPMIWKDIIGEGIS